MGLGLECQLGKQGALQFWGPPKGRAHDTWP